MPTWLCGRPDTACAVAQIWPIRKGEWLLASADKSSNPCRQCSSGLQAIASVAASIQAGYYDIGLAGGVESMSTNPMAWDGGVNPKIADNQEAQDCLLPMGALPCRLAAGLLLALVMLGMSAELATLSTVKSPSTASLRT